MRWKNYEIKNELIGFLDYADINHSYILFLYSSLFICVSNPSSGYHLIVKELSTVVSRLLIPMVCLLLGILTWSEPVILTLKVNGVKRTARVYPGKDALNTLSPLVLAFHGYSSSARAMSTVNLQDAWPEATVVYPQGLMVEGKTTQREEPGWQQALEESGNRDLYFVDALMKELDQRYRIDHRRVYATGMSNGALFCYLLLAARPEKFAAFALIAGSSTLIRECTVPRPLMIIQGKNDKVMPIDWAVWTCNYARRLNGCGKEMKEWAPGYISYEPSSTGQPVIWHEHNGGHIWPSDATEYVVRFFKEHQLTDAEVEGG